jgi:excinuclease UvrABC ATPase subunit
LGARRPGAEGEFRKELAALARDGYSRVVVDGEVRDPASRSTSTGSANTTSTW